jgi:hypothetical protein
MQRKIRVRQWRVVIREPKESDPLYHSWLKCNMMVISWITKSVSPSIAQSIVYFDLAAQVWKDLKDRLSTAYAFRLSDLLQSLDFI